MQGWVQSARKILASDHALVLATVVASKGSVPRGAGTKMLISGKRLIGTIGGGNLEYQIVDQARKLLTAGEPDYLLQNYALGPLLEQCCGGSVEVMLERLDNSNAAFLVDEPEAFLKTTYDGCHFQKEWSDKYQRHPVVLFGADGARTDIAKEAMVMIEEVGRQPAPLYMFGAGHVGRAVAEALAPLPFDVTWIDSRADEFPDMIPVNAAAHVSEDYLPFVDKAPKDAFYLIFTHSHQLDYEITAKILARGDAQYCGLIGSATKRARFENRMLRERVITAAELPNLTCPIGLAGIDGKEPAVIAVAVAAQLLSCLD